MVRGTLFSVLVLALPIAVRAVGFFAGAGGLHWVRYQQTRGWHDLSPESASMRAHNRRYPEQQWIATGCLLVWLVGLGAIVIGIPLLTGHDLWIIRR